MTKQEKVEYVIKSIEKYVDAAIRVSKSEDTTKEFEDLSQEKANLKESLALVFEVELN